METKLSTEIMRIFQLGFNKCGSCSIVEAFRRAGVPALHNGGGSIARELCSAARDDRPPVLPGSIVLFADMEDHDRGLYANKLFRELDRWFPEARFVLNTRDLDSWLASRANWRRGKYMRTSMRRHGRGSEETVAHWAHEWELHHRAVRTYFAGRPGKLLEYHLTRDPPAKLREFFSDLRIGRIPVLNRRRARPVWTRSRIQKLLAHTNETAQPPASVQETEDA